MACDLAVAARSASFIQAFSKIGLVPDAGGTWFLLQEAGPGARDGLRDAGRQGAGAAGEEWGMIWKCVDDDALAAETAQLARHLATLPTKALA